MCVVMLYHRCPMVTKNELKTTIHALINQLNAARDCLDVLKGRVRRLKKNIKKNKNKTRRRRPAELPQEAAWGWELNSSIGGSSDMIFVDGIYE